MGAADFVRRHRGVAAAARRRRAGLRAHTAERSRRRRAGSASPARRSRCSRARCRAGRCAVRRRAATRSACSPRSPTPRRSRVSSRWSRRSEHASRRPESRHDRTGHHGRSTPPARSCASSPRPRNRWTRVGWRTSPRPSTTTSSRRRRCSSASEHGPRVGTAQDLLVAAFGYTIALDGRRPGRARPRRRRGARCTDRDRDRRRRRERAASSSTAPHSIAAGGVDDELSPDAADCRSERAAARAAADGSSRCRPRSSPTIVRCARVPSSPSPSRRGPADWYAGSRAQGSAARCGRCGARPLPRIAITTAVPSAKVAPRWGDWHFGADLARALRRRGHEVRLQTADQADTVAGRACDIHLVLHGLANVARTEGQRHVIWVISHPETLSTAEADAADLVFVASEQFAARLQARTRTPGRSPPAGHRPRIASTRSRSTRGSRIRSSSSPRPAPSCDRSSPTRSRPGIRPAIYGSGWEEFVDPSLVVAPYVANEDLPIVYASAGVVLNDHWATMRADGFVSNRIFDVLACGTPVISDHLPEIAELFGDAVPTYRRRRRPRGPWSGTFWTTRPACPRPGRGRSGPRPGGSHLRPPGRARSPMRSPVTDCSPARDARVADARTGPAGEVVRSPPGVLAECWRRSGTIEQCGQRSRAKTRTGQHDAACRRACGGSIVAESTRDMTRRMLFRRGGTAALGAAVVWSAPSIRTIALRRRTPTGHTTAPTARRNRERNRRSRTDHGRRPTAAVAPAVRGRLAAVHRLGPAPVAHRGRHRGRGRQRDHRVLQGPEARARRALDRGDYAGRSSTSSAARVSWSTSATTSAEDRHRHARRLPSSAIAARSMPPIAPTVRTPSQRCHTSVAVGLRWCSVRVGAVVDDHLVVEHDRREIVARTRPAARRRGPDSSPSSGDLDRSAELLRDRSRRTGFGVSRTRTGSTHSAATSAPGRRVRPARAA